MPTSNLQTLRPTLIPSPDIKATLKLTNKLRGPKTRKCNVREMGRTTLQGVCILEHRISPAIRNLRSCGSFLNPPKLSSLRALGPALTQVQGFRSTLHRVFFVPPPRPCPPPPPFTLLPLHGRSAFWPCVCRPPSSMV